MSISTSINRRGGSLRAIVRSLTIASASGVVATAKASLLAPVTYGSKTGNANLSISSAGEISAAAAIAAGASQTIGFVATGSDGCTQPWSMTLTGAYVIAAIAANVSTDLASGSIVASITGVPTGQTPTISPADGRFVIAGDEAGGWKLARGLSAISVGTFEGSVSAPGAVSGTVTLTISEPAVSTAVLRVNAPAVIVGNSKNTAGTGVGPNYVGYGLAMSGSRYYQGPGARLSHAGDRVDDYRSRIGYAVPLLRHGGMGGLLLLGDATNDYGVSGRTVAAIVADYRYMAEQVLADSANNAVLIELTPKYTTLSGQGETDRQAGNAAIIAMCGEPGWNGRVQYSDQSGLGVYLADPAESADGKHYYTYTLAFRAAAILAAKLDSMIEAGPIAPASGALPTPTGFGPNLMVNYALADVSSVNGQADSFTYAAGTGAALAYSNSGGEQTIQKSGTATGTGVVDIMQKIDVPITATRPGRVFEHFVNVDYTSGGGYGISLDSGGQPGFQTPTATVGSTVPTRLPSFSGTLRYAQPPIRPSNNAQNTTSFVSVGLHMRNFAGAATDKIVVKAGWYVRETEKVAYSAPIDLTVAFPSLGNGPTFTLVSPLTITNNAGSLYMSVVPLVLGGGFNDYANGIVYQWQRSTDAGATWSNVGTDDRIYATGGVTGSRWRLRVTYQNGIGSPLTLTSNELTT